MQQQAKDFVLGGDNDQRFMRMAIEAAKVAQDTRLSKSTRKYLLSELSLLQKAFEPSEKTSSEKSSQSH